MWKTRFLIITLILLGNMTFCFAGQTETSISVDVQINGTTTNIANYTMEELQAIPQTQMNYSSVNAYDAPSITVAQGIVMADFLQELAIPMEGVSAISFISSDGGVLNYRAEDYLNNNRYFFNGIFNGDQGKTQVPAMISLKKYEESFSSTPDALKMNASEGISFCFGQKDVTDKVSIAYGKYINRIILVLKEEEAFAPPQKPYGTGTASADMGKPSEASIAAEDKSLTPVAEADIDQGLTPDTLTITVGYYGGPYTVKKIFSLDELYKMQPKDQVYSYIDNMPAVVLESARGIRLTDLLESAGIDVNSVESFHFFCSDVENSWYQSINKEYLIDTVRYYYPNLQTSWDYDISAAGTDAIEGEVEVDTMIALEDNWKRFATEPNFTELVKKSRFRLVFGQTDVSTKNAYRSARWIHTIEVMLGGKPPETVEQKPVPSETTVGSKLRHNDGLGSGTEENHAGIQNWRVYEMSDKAAELEKAESENPLLPCIGVMAALTLLLGIAFGTIGFYREV